MLISSSIHPEATVYYRTTLLLKVLLSYPSYVALDVSELFQKVNEERKIPFHAFMLCLDWLFLTDLITEFNGKIKKCF